MDKLRTTIVDIMTEKESYVIDIIQGDKTTYLKVPAMTVLLIAAAQDNRLAVASKLTGMQCTGVRLPKVLNKDKLTDDYVAAAINIVMHMGYMGDYLISTDAEFVVTEANPKNCGVTIAEQVPAFTSVCELLNVKPECVSCVSNAERVDRIIKECFSYVVFSRAPEKIRKDSYYDPDVAEDPGASEEIVPKFDI